MNIGVLRELVTNHSAPRTKQKFDTSLCSPSGAKEKLICTIFFVCWGFPLSSEWRKYDGRFPTEPKASQNNTIDSLEPCLLSLRHSSAVLLSPPSIGQVQSLILKTGLWGVIIVYSCCIRKELYVLMFALQMFEMLYINLDKFQMPESHGTSHPKSRLPTGRVLALCFMG